MQIDIRISGEDWEPGMLALATALASLGKAGPDTGGGFIMSGEGGGRSLGTVDHDTGMELLKGRPTEETKPDPKPRKPKATPVATDAAKPSGSETIENEPESESSVSTTSTPSTVVDAGTGKPVASGEAVTREAAKAVAAKLTQIPGGNDTLKALFAKYGAQKFSGIGDDSLTPFAADVEAALAAAATE